MPEKHMPLEEQATDERPKAREKDTPALKKAQNKVRRHIEDEKQKPTPESVNPDPPLSPGRD